MSKTTLGLGLSPGASGGAGARRLRRRRWRRRRRQQQRRRQRRRRRRRHFTLSCSRSGHGGRRLEPARLTPVHRPNTRRARHLLRRVRHHLTIRAYATAPTAGGVRQRSTTEPDHHHISTDTTGRRSRRRPYYYSVVANVYGANVGSTVRRGAGPQHTEAGTSHPSRPRRSARMYGRQCRRAVALRGRCSTTGGETQLQHVGRPSPASGTSPTASRWTRPCWRHAVTKRTCKSVSIGGDPTPRPHTAPAFASGITINASSTARDFNIGTANSAASTSARRPQAGGRDVYTPRRPIAHGGSNAMCRRRIAPIRASAWPVRDGSQSLPEPLRGPVHLTTIQLRTSYDGAHHSPHRSRRPGRPRVCRGFFRAVLPFGPKPAILKWNP